MSRSPANASGVPGRPLDHFAVFDLAPAFDLNLQELERRFHALQKHCHPDRNRDSDPELQVAARLNEAYRQLRSPVSRARCLLEHLGRTLDAEDRSCLDPQELERQFEWRMELEEADSLQELEALRQRARDELAELGRKFAAAWEQRDCDLAEKHYHGMQFADRFASAVDEREEDLLELGT